MAKNFRERIRLWWIHREEEAERLLAELQARAGLAEKNYDFTPELRAKIEAAVFRRWRQPTACLACGGLEWYLLGKFATVMVMDNYWTIAGSSGLPSAAFICEQCGFTMLFNLLTLGFRDSIGPDLVNSGGSNGWTE